MSRRNTLLRSMHDLGLAAWFGGSLMGAVGLNGSTGQAHDPSERIRLSSVGWGLWAPVAAGAIGVHGVGGLGLIATNRGRVAHDQGTTVNTAVKAAVTITAAALTAYSGVLGLRVTQGAAQGAKGSVTPGEETPPAVAAAQHQLKVIQFAIPVLTGVAIVLGAQQGEQQRPSQQLVARLSSGLTG